MSIFSHWKKSDPIVEQYYELGWENFVETPAGSGNWQGDEVYKSLSKIVGYRRPQDEASKAKRARDLKVLAIALSLLAIASALIGLRFGATHQWNHFATFAKQHPMAIAAPLGTIAIIASAILAGKKSSINKELITLATIAALLALAAGTSYMEAPSILKYVLSHPQLMAMPIFGYVVIRLTHHFLSKKKEHITNAVNNGTKSLVEGEGDKRNLTDRAGLLATAALIGIVAIGLLGWSGSYTKIGHFFQNNWQDVLKFSAVGLFGLGILGAILWAFNRGADETKEVRILTQEEEKREKVLQSLKEQWKQLCGVGRHSTLIDPDLETTFLRDDARKRCWPMPEYGETLDDFAMQIAQADLELFTEMRNKAQDAGLTELALGMSRIEQKAQEAAREKA